jgi:hypothetical protein
LFTNDSSWQAKQSIPHTIVTLYAYRAKMCENTAVGIRHADHVAPSNPQKLTLPSPTSSGRSVGIVRSRTQATECIFNFRFRVSV